MIPTFPFLAIETSGELCSAALILDEKKYSEFNIRMKHVHSEKLLGMIKEILDAANIKVSELKFIAISEGPGSFTGLRIGMAAAKGLAFGADLPILPVPTFNAFAYKISAFVRDDQIFCIANNVNIEELYFAKYKKVNNSCEAIDDLRLVKKENFEENIKDDELVFGNYLNKNSIYDSPSAIDIGLWAYKFGKDLLTSEYDFIEPKYLKEFVARIKK